MVKVANEIPVLGYLRDIRLSGFKRQANGKAAPGTTSRLNEAELSSETLLEREQAGYERGKRETEEQAARQIQQLQREWEETHRAEVIGRLEKLNGSVQHQMTEMFKVLEKHVVMLAAEAAIKLTAGIPVSADMVEAYVREAMNLVEQDTEITVMIHPDDLVLLEQHQSSLLNRANTSPVLRFRVDPKISRGGCLLETKFGEFDARRETRIEMLKKAVNE